MGDSSSKSDKFGDTGMIELTGKIMVVAIILLFFVVVFVFCLHLYAKWFWHRRQENATTTTATTRRRRRRFDFAGGHEEDVPVVSILRQGLDPLVLKTIPVVVYDAKEFKDGLECAVCLCEVSQGEKARLLPKCNHGFHVDCIDMWFQSHSTCPLCRNPVLGQNQSCSDSTTSESTLESILQTPNVENAETPNFPTNVLFWGNETQISTMGPCLEEVNQGTAMVGASSQALSGSSSSSSGSTSNRPEGMLVVDIPRQSNEEEDQKSPVPTRLRSLKRLLSGNRRVNPASPRNVDLEQGDESSI